MTSDALQLVAELRTLPPQAITAHVRAWLEAHPLQPIGLTTTEQYVLADGCACPYCASLEIEAEPPKWYDRTCVQYVHCPACRGDWREIYSLCDVEEDRQPPAATPGERMAYIRTQQWRPLGRAPQKPPGDTT